jgi:hypothetical protein
MFMVNLGESEMDRSPELLAAGFVRTAHGQTLRNTAFTSHGADN